MANQIERQDAGESYSGGEMADKKIREVVVANQLGLHARPAGVLAQEAQNFTSAIALRSDGQEVDAKSILDILTLAAGQGAKLELVADGEDADAAIERLTELFSNKFGGN